MKRNILIYIISIVIMILPVSSGAYAQEKVFKAPIDRVGVQIVKILGGSYFFDPDYIILKVNVPVELTVMKEPGMTPHNFVIKEPGAGMNIDVSLSEEPQTLMFTPVKTGAFPFYCSKKLLFFKSHREKGMEGIIKVIE